MKKITLVLLLAAIAAITYTQSPQEKAKSMKNEAIELMDNGKIEESLKLLEEAQSIDPENIDITYEIAFAYQLAKDYNKCIEIAKPLLKHPDIFDQVYQIIGNCYDLLGDKEKAIKTYDKGIKKFPHSGRLFLEKGIVIASQEKWFEALAVWEQGVIADPTHSSNYFYASLVLSQTDEIIWGIYYGEIFLNLEPNTPRTSQISRLLFEDYKKCLPIEDNKWGLAFSRKATNIVIGGSIKDLKFSFETVHNLAMEKAYKNVEPVFNMANLITIQKQFLAEWNENYAERYPNLIFDYHNFLLENSNMFESYYYWLLKDGEDSGFDAWKEKNKEKYENFLSWFEENPMLFTEKNQTNRFSYD